MENLAVIENVRLSNHTFRLRTERPSVRIRAGQCFSVGTKELGINREYSMYSAADDPFIDFLIREVDDGIVSPALAKCRAGDYVEIGGPYGDFCLPNESILNESFVFVASGTGIAPFHSFVKTYQTLEYTIFHGVRHEDEQYDAHLYPTERYFSAVSQPSDGRRPMRVTNLLRSADLNTESYYYLCGNRMMITDVVQILRNRGIPGGRIFMETFF